MSRPVPVLAEVSRSIRPLALARDQVVPVLPALADLVPDGGLVRGGVTLVGGRAAPSLALALIAGASAAGSWTVVVGCPDLGLAAAAEAGLALDRLALVAEPETGAWANVVAALVGAVDVVVVGPSHRVRAPDARRLAARARERGTVLVQLAGRQPGLEADLRLTVTEVDWQGLGRGHGHLEARRLVVEASGRRRAARPRRAELWCPDRHGAITLISPPASLETGHLRTRNPSTQMPTSGDGAGLRDVG
jgi:hypothetical protein